MVYDVLKYIFKEGACYVTQAGYLGVKMIFFFLHFIYDDDDDNDDDVYVWA